MKHSKKHSLVVEFLQLIDAPQEIYEALFYRFMVHKSVAWLEYKIATFQAKNLAPE